MDKERRVVIRKIGTIYVADFQRLERTKDPNPLDDVWDVFPEKTIKSHTPTAFEVEITNYLSQEVST